MQVTLGSIAQGASWRPASASSQPRFGKPVAHVGLLNALVRSGVAARAEVFSTSLMARPGEGPVPPSTDPGLTPRLLAELPVAVLEPGYLFLSSGIESLRLGQVRWGLDAPSFPITTLIHAVNWTDMFTSYTGLCCTSAPHDAVVVTSSAARTALEQMLARVAERCGAQLRAAIMQIPLGFDLDAMPTVAAPTARDLLQISHDDCVLLYFGRLTPAYKADLEPLLAVASRFAARGTRVRWLLAGSDQEGYAARLEARAAALGLGRAVAVVPDPPDVVKHLLYAASDVFVSPSDNIQESFGLSIVEAMAHALPVVASDWSGYRDLVSEGRTGFLVPAYLDPLTCEAASMLAPLDVGYGPAQMLAQHTVLDLDCLESRLATLIADADLRRTMGAAARHVVETELSWPCVAERYRSLFASQLQARPTEPAASRMAVPLADVFGHYATALLSADTVVAATDAGRRAVRERRAATWTDDEVRAARIVSDASDPTPLSRWIADPFDPVAWQAILRLLKIGSLRVVDVRSC